MNFDILGYRIVIVRLPIIVKHTCGARGPPHDLPRRIVWQRYTPHGMTLAHLVRPALKANLKNEQILEEVKMVLIGIPLKDEKELDNRILRTIRSCRARLKR